MSWDECSYVLGSYAHFLWDADDEEEEEENQLEAKTPPLVEARWSTFSGFAHLFLSIPKSQLSKLTLVLTDVSRLACSLLELELME